jgi:hypothetical protein
MNSGRLIFSQLMDFLPMHEFRRCIERYEGNKRVRAFSCWDQFLCMAFAQLTYRESLRDIEACLRAIPRKRSHMGIKGSVARSTLAVANENRDWRIYADFAQVLISQARTLYADDVFGPALSETVKEILIGSGPVSPDRPVRGSMSIPTLSQSGYSDCVGPPAEYELLL